MKLQFYRSFTDKAVVIYYITKIGIETIKANETLFTLFYQHCECHVQESELRINKAME